MNNPKVGVILINWNGLPDTLECIASLQRQTYPNYEIIVVDNHSSDDSVKKIQQAASDLKLIASDKNLGFAGGNNLGLKKAIADQCSLFLLINNDTLIEDKNFLTSLVETTVSNPEFGMICPLILTNDAPRKIWYAGSALNLWTGWNHFHAQPETTLLVETGYATGCCVMVNKDFLAEIGMLNEQYFFSVEDVEWSYRARIKGWKIGFYPAVSIIHKESLSSRASAGQGKYSPLRVYYENRNAIFMIRKYGNWFQKFFLWPVRFGYRFFIKMAAYLVLKRPEKAKSLLAAYRDGIRSGLV